MDLCDAEDGKKDISEAFWDSSVPFYIQERDALETGDRILQAVQEPGDEDLSSRLSQVPLYSYFVKLRSRIKLLLQEGLVEKGKLYLLGLRLTSQREKSEEVKLGILILGFFENNEVKHLFADLGRLGRFTLYVLEAAKDFHNFNSFVFELAKHTSGYGKIAALSVLQPITEEMKEWVLYQGAENKTIPNMAAIISLEKADMVRYFIELPLNAGNFSAVSTLLANALEASNIKSFYIGLPLTQKYLDKAPALAKNFIDFSAILAIYHSINGAVKAPDPSENPERNTGWTSEIEKKIESVCYNLLHQGKWKSIVGNALTEAVQPANQILSALRELQMVPPFEAFLPMLQKHPFNFELFHFLIYDNMFSYTDEAFRYTKAIWPDEVFGGALDLTQENLNPSFEPDFCLCFLLKAMYYFGINSERFYLLGLSCRLPDCRKEAIRCLRSFRTLWSPAVIPALEAACEIEPTKKIRKSLLRLLGKKEEHSPKEQRYADLPDPRPEPENGDVCLFETRVAGAFYRDLLAVEGVLEANDLLYLVREPENSYDSNAILVTTDDGYILGYIPKVVNPMPAALMDSGKQLYALLNEVDLHRSQLDISVILKESADSSDYIDPFLTVIKGGKEL